jgi:site-specific DNA-methyltransferase (adenine-specific)
MKTQTSSIKMQDVLDCLNTKTGIETRNKIFIKMSEGKKEILLGDCLELMKDIPNGSIDMILCDLPYGTTQNKWDSVIDLDQLWKHYERIIKDDGAIALTAQGLFTAKLIMSNEKLFKYKIVWIKSKSTNFLNAKKQPLRKHEDICLFYKKQPTYNPQMTNGDAYDKGIRKDQYTGSYGYFKPKHVKSNGERYPNDVVCYEEQPIDDFVYVKTAESEGPVLHPTQKPVALFEYLVKTYSRENDLVLDNCAGSGTTAIACLNTNRQFIVMEQDPNYFEKIKKRVGDFNKNFETQTLFGNDI